MENLFPLFFVLYILSTIISALVKKKQGDSGEEAGAPERRERRTRRSVFPFDEEEPSLDEPRPEPLRPQPFGRAELSEARPDQVQPETQRPADVRPAVHPEPAARPESAATKASPARDAALSRAQLERMERAFAEDGLPGDAFADEIDGREADALPVRMDRKGRTYGRSAVRLTRRSFRQGFVFAEIVGAPRAFRQYELPNVGRAPRR